MNVEWYSHDVKPVEPYSYENTIVIAMRGRIFVTDFYFPDDNTVHLHMFSGGIPLNHPIIDGWCYAKDLYPKETKL